jgi:hypothetical protein
MNKKRESSESKKKLSKEELAILVASIIPALISFVMWIQCMGIIAIFPAIPALAVGIHALVWKERKLVKERKKLAERIKKKRESVDITKIMEWHERHKFEPKSISNEFVEALRISLLPIAVSLVLLSLPGLELESLKNLSNDFPDFFQIVLVLATTSAVLIIPAASQASSYKGSWSRALGIIKTGEENGRKIKSKRMWAWVKAEIKWRIRIRYALISVLFTSFCAILFLASLLLHIVFNGVEFLVIASVFGIPLFIYSLCYLVASLH